jgi:biopolymer transport protein ExbB
VIVCGLLIGGPAVVNAQDIPTGGDLSGLDEAAGGGDAEEAPAEEPAGEEAGAPEGVEEGAAEGEAEAGAEGEDAGAGAGEGDVSVLKLVLQNSGIPGWIIIGMSVVALYLVVRMLFELRRDELMPEELILALEDDLDGLELRQAMQKCMASDSVLARVMRSALREVRAGYDGMMEAMEETGEAESIRLHQHVGWLSIIGAIAPMLGLTGTVLGMMAAFGTISQMEQQPPPRVLAENIQLALTTTCEGLVVAVPVLLFYAMFRNRVTALMLDVGVAADDLLSRFKNVDVTPSMVAEVREAAEAGVAAQAGPAPEEEGAVEAPGGPSWEEEEGEEEDVPPPPPPPE